MAHITAGVAHLGTDTRLVKINEIDDSGGAHVVDPLGNSLIIPMGARRGKGGVPEIGESWIIDRYLGAWTFAAIVNYQPKSITADQGDIGSLVQQLLGALTTFGVTVNDTTGSPIGPDGFIPDDHASPAAPTGFAVTASVRSISASWNANAEIDTVPGWGVYILEWSTTSSFVGAQSLTTAATVAALDGLNTGQQYYLRVLAQDVHGNQSPWAAPLTVIPVQVLTGDIGNQAVGTTQIANNAVTGGQVAPGSISAPQLNLLTHFIS